MFVIGLALGGPLWGFLGGLLWGPMTKSFGNLFENLGIFVIGLEGFLGGSLGRFLGGPMTKSLWKPVQKPRDFGHWSGGSFGRLLVGPMTKIIWKPASTRWGQAYPRA